MALGVHSEPLMLGKTLLAALLAAIAAQAENRAEARTTFGMASFLDESPIRHFEVGGSVRVYLTRRLSVGPEFLYMRAGSRDQDYLLMASAALDLRKPNARVAPYLTGGVGILWNRQIVGTGPYVASTTAWAAGNRSQDLPHEAVVCRTRSAPRD